MTAPVRGQRPRYRARPEQAGPRTIAWFSRGAASAVMTKQAIETLPAVEVVCIALTTEHPDSSRFADDCERWFGQPITYIASDRFADTWDVWEKRRFLVGPHGAPCTGELKKAVQQRQRQRQTNRRRRCSNASLLNRQLRNRHVSRRP